MTQTERAMPHSKSFQSGATSLWRPELAHEPIGDRDQRRLDGGEGWQVWMYVAHRPDIEFICSRARRAVPSSSAARTGFAASRRNASTSLRSHCVGELVVVLAAPAGDRR